VENPWKAARRPYHKQKLALILANLRHFTLEFIPHEGWFTTHDEFRAGAGEGSLWRMDAFYRYVRRKTGILMGDEKPAGGKYSFDRENRFPWRGNPRLPAPPTFPLDPIKEEVGRLIESKFSPLLAVWI
jgi:deoxyribodipyrimidine photolyase-related protein